MMKLAVAEKESFEVSDCEVKRPGPSYTIDTVSHFKELYGPDSAIYWLVGADAIGELQYWHKIGELIDRCNLAVMYRAGFPAPKFSHLRSALGQSRIEKLRRNVVETPLIDISSSEIRKNLAAGRDVTDMVPPQVLAYIKRKNLYSG